MSDASTSEPSAPQPSPTHSPSSGSQPNSNTYAAIAYVLTWITGIIIYLVADKNDKYARWHAIQAIGLGIALWIIGIVIGYLPLGLLGALWWPIVVIIVIVFAIKAYQGEMIRLPVISDMADKNA